MLQSLSFSRIAFSDIQSTRIPFFPKPPSQVFDLLGVQLFLYSPNFFPNPFGSSGFPYFSQACQPSGSLLCIVFFDYVYIYRVWKIVTVHGGRCCNTAKKYFLDHMWPFVCGIPFAPGISMVYPMFEVVDQPLITRFLIVLTFLSIF